MDVANINKSHEDTIRMQEAIMENINKSADISIDVNEAQNVYTERAAGRIETEAFEICETITEDTNDSSMQFISMTC